VSETLRSATALPDLVSHALQSQLVDLVGDAADVAADAADVADVADDDAPSARLRGRTRQRIEVVVAIRPTST
jgi:hypothetical protein